MLQFNSSYIKSQWQVSSKKKIAILKQITTEVQSIINKKLKNQPETYILFSRNIVSDDVQNVMISSVAQ